MLDAVGGVGGTLGRQVEGAGRGGEDLADPVGDEGAEGGVGRELRHALAAPADDVGDEDVVAEVDLGLDQDPPAAGAAAALVERPVHLVADCADRVGVPEPRTRVEIERAADDLGDLVGGSVDDVLVGGGAVDGLMVHGEAHAASLR